MSKLIYIAGDYPLKEVKDPHIKTMSVNEALAAEVEVLDMLLQDEKLDRDEPDVVLWMDDESDIMDDHFSIIPFEKWDEIHTKKTYCAHLDWKYSKGRTAQVIAYIKDYLQYTEEAEIWNIWIGTSYPPPRIKKIKISADELTPELLEKIDSMDSYQEPALYKGYVPNAWDISEEELNPDTQYCYVVRKL